MTSQTSKQVQDLLKDKASSTETVNVVMRCRPLSTKEMTEGNEVAVKIDTKKGEIFVSKPGYDEAPKQFTFDEVFDWTIPQEQIYNRCAAHIIENVLEGYNGTIFAYGQTGTGKTHTMSGVENDPVEEGIMPRSFRDVFQRIDLDSLETQFLIRASYLEIYNEEVRDLLAKNPRNRLDLHEKPDSGVYVKDLSFFAVKNVAEIHDVMKHGMKNRSVGSTNMNNVSSRSHSLFQITIERSEIGADGKQHIRVGKLNMVDLAGSERIAKTGATGDRLKEATKINLSLSTLCHVISALTDPKNTYVPYRDSKLTRLLQDSLGGNTKTLMISNIGPADYNYDETINTLRYANRAKNIKNKPKINEDPKDALLREYQDEITKLKEQLLLLNKGGDISELYKQKGIMGNVVEKIVHVEDKEQMAEFEQKLERQKEEIKVKAEKDKLEIEQQANLKKEEKDKLIDEIRKREEAEEKAKTKQQKLINRLKKMEEKMVVGSQAIEVAKKQQKELKKTQKKLKREQQQQAELDQQLKKEEEDLMIKTHKFNNVQEELEYKSKKLEKLWYEFNEAQDLLNTCQEDFDRERNDMFDTIYELTNQLKLKNLIIEHFMPPEEYKNYEKVTVWSEQAQDWVINHPAKIQNPKQTASKRPQSAVGMKRPTSEYSRIAKGLGDLNPRYKLDNILQLDLDMPERTTEDYEGVPSMKVQQAIQAILADENNKEVVPINTLVNFSDSILDDYGNDQTLEASQSKSRLGTASSSRQKSGTKRPKSAKKKKLD